MREGRIANVALLNAPRGTCVSFADHGPDNSEPLYAWRVERGNGRVVYTRNDWVCMPHLVRRWLWIDLVPAPEIFVA